MSAARPRRGKPAPRVFEERYPGIKVTIGGGFSNVLDKKIDAQLAAGKLEVDAAILQTAADYVRWKREGRLITFKPNGFDKMDAAFKDRDGTYWATMVNVVPYMYNTEKVAAADIPNAATDFLKPQFQGKIVTAYPADDDVTLWVFYHIVQKYGWSYMDKYMAAEAELHSGPSRRAAQHRLGPEHRHLRFDPRHHRRTEAPGPAGRLAYPDRRRAADLAAERRDLQGRAASECGKAVPVVAACAGAASQAADLVAAQRRAAAGRLQADPVVQGRQRLPRFPHRPEKSRGAAQEVRGL